MQFSGLTPDGKTAKSGCRVLRGQWSSKVISAILLPLHCWASMIKVFHLLSVPWPPFHLQSKVEGNRSPPPQQ